MHIIFEARLSINGNYGIDVYHEIDIDPSRQDIENFQSEYGCDIKSEMEEYNEHYETDEDYDNDYQAAMFLEYESVYSDAFTTFMEKKYREKYLEKLEEKIHEIEIDEL